MLLQEVSTVEKSDIRDYNYSLEQIIELETKRLIQDSEASENNVYKVNKITEGTQYFGFKFFHDESFS